MDHQCKGCALKKEEGAKYNSEKSALAECCNKICPMGARLRELGQQLGRGADKPMSASRQRSREWVNEIKRKGPNYGAALSKDATARLEQDGEEAEADQS
nr:zinc-finger domain-containing protein [Cohnella sp. GbtcB17]